MVGNDRQTNILADRYFSVIMGDWANLFLLFVQVPVIAGIICLIWSGTKADVRLHMALCLSAIWLGLFNSCREVVKERALYERERRLFLKTTSYLFSKIYILALLCSIQTIGLLWAVDYYVGLTGSKILLWLALFLGSMGGVCLGLFISCLVSTPDRAVTLAPVVMLPQVFFCKGFVPSDSTHGIVGTLKKLMLIEWVGRSFEHFLRFGRDMVLLDAFLDLTALVVYILALLGLSILVLEMEKLK